MAIQNQRKLLHYTDEYIMFGMMFLLGNKLQVLGDNFYEEFTSKQWFVLIMLKVFDEPPTINELSDAMGSSHQNVKQLVLKLESKGYLELYTDKLDKRKTRIKLTKKVAEIADKYRKQENEFMKQLYQGIDKDKLRTTLETLLQFEKNMEVIKDEYSRSI